MSLQRAILLALLAKAVILALLWQAFFAQPSAPRMRMPTQAVASHLLGAALPSNPTDKANHAPVR